MSRSSLVVAFLAAWFLATGPSCLLAEEKGLADLDKATQLQLNAETIADLEKVIDHCEKALAAGLSDENQDFAKELLASTLVDHARRLTASVLRQPQGNQRWPMVRDAAVRDLEKAVKYQPKLAEAHMMRAQLLAMPGGDRKEALKAAATAVDLLKNDKSEYAKALVLRGQLSPMEEDQLKDWAAAIAADPNCVEAWQARASLYLSKGDREKAIADLKKLISISDDNLVARFALIEALVSLKQTDEAFQELATVIKNNPELPLGYMTRARLYLMQKDTKKAVEDLDQAIKIEPRDLSALLLRAQIHLEEENFAKAREDVDRILQLQPKLIQGILLRASISASEEKYPEAIKDLKPLLEDAEIRPQVQVQIAQLYIAGGWPRQAIKLLTQVIEANEDAEQGWRLLRMRGDAFLNIGRHAEAIADFEKALKAKPDDSGILNNLAWVLATTPDEKLRNAKRAIELGKKACEVTDYKASHILSTLAAGYAESGDFDQAIEWSTKAVEMGEGENKEQLAKELESYKQKKPWREKQENAEKPNPPILETDAA